MPTAANTSSPSSSAPLAEEQPSLADSLDFLCQRVLAYAAGAKVQRFRYCRRPLRPRSPHRTLGQAVQALDAQLAAAEAQPRHCQTLAVDFLRELAALGHQPPCQGSAQQKKAALLINTALLELR